MNEPRVASDAASCRHEAMSPPEASRGLAPRLRVLHAITMLELGGAQRNTLDTVRLLDRKQFEVALTCADEGELLGEASSYRDVTLFPLRSLRREVRFRHDLRAVAELRRAVREFAPDIVHTHSSKAGVLGRLAAHRERVSVVIHSIHGFGFGKHQSWPVRRAFLTAERLAARWTHHFIAVSHENLDEGVRLRIFPASRASVIRSGIELARFRAPSGGDHVRAELGIPGDAPVVLQVACFKPQKAPERFVELAGRVLRTVPDAHFVLVGDGDLRPSIERLRAQSGLTARLHLTGWRRDIPALLSAATIVTLTSRFEGLPRAVVEALAAGVPVVAMAVDGVVEVVRDGVNGFLVAEGETSTMAERVTAVLSDPALRARLIAASSQGLEEFDRDLMVRRQEQLYLELASRRFGPRTPRPGRWLRP